MEIDSIQTNDLEVNGNPSAAGINDNIIINGDFDIWQRGTSFNINAVAEYTADRWFCDSGSVGSSGTFSRREFSVGQTNVPGEPQYNIRFTSTTAVGTCAFIQPVEDVRRIADRTMTLSFYCYGSIAMSGCSIGIYNIYDGSEAEYVFNSSTFDVGTSWSKKIITFTTPSLSGKTIGINSLARIYIRFNPVDGETANLSHVKLEEGSVATPFVKRQPAEELISCQRYYWTNPATIYGGIYSTNSMIFIPFPVTMRSTPTITATIRGTVSATYVDKYKVQLKDSDYTETYVLSGDIIADAEL